MRNVFASFALLVALMVGLVGTVLHWIDNTVRSPEPTAQLAQAIVSDKSVLTAVADLLDDAIAERIPESANQLPQLREYLPEVIKLAVDEAMSSSDSHATWRSVLDESRRATVADLERYHTDRSSGAPSVWLQLDPLVKLVWQEVQDSADPVTGQLIGEVELPQDVRIKAADLKPEQAGLASEVLHAASHWWLAYGIAIALLMLGIVLGTGVARWVILTVFAVLGIGSVFALRGLIGAATFHDPGSQLATAVGGHVVGYLGNSLETWLGAFLYLSCGLAVIGIAGTVVTGVRGPR